MKNIFIVSFLFIATLVFLGCGPYSPSKQPQFIRAGNGMMYYVSPYNCNKLQINNNQMYCLDPEGRKTGPYNPTSEDQYRTYLMERQTRAAEDSVQQQSINNMIIQQQGQQLNQNLQNLNNPVLLPPINRNSGTWFK